MDQGAGTKREGLMTMKMRLIRRILVMLACFPAVVFAASSPVGKANVEQQPGMVITGDQEAPLVMYIVPWKDSDVPDPPDVLRQPLLPPVLDYNRSLIDDPLNRSVGPRPRASPD